MTTFKASMTRVGISDVIITLDCTNTPGLVARFFGAKEARWEERYIGSCTGWLTYPGFKVVTVHNTKMLLHRVERQLAYEEKYGGIGITINVNGYSPSKGLIARIEGH